VSEERTETGARHDGRADDELRPITFVTGYLKHPAGSVLLHVGDTRVLASASVEDRVPPFLAGKGEGWITAEYSMLPAATSSRSQRESTRGRPSGRTMEIQRLIGRALRSVLDRSALGERTLWIDCDVLQADGGTRTASITAGFVALCLALRKLQHDGAIDGPPLSGMVAAVSVGLIGGRPVLDLDYVEDSAADVDMNVVRTDDGRYVELQGTAENEPFPRSVLDALLARADQGLDELQDRQRDALGLALDPLLLPR
jgi:ribonuclease PH